MKAQLSDSSVNPRDVKRALGRALVELYHGKDAAHQAEQHFDQVIVNKDAPEDMDEIILSKNCSIIDIITDSGMTKSKGEARRMMKQGAVRIDNEKVTDIDLVISKGNEMVIKVGKRRFLRVK